MGGHYRSGEADKAKVLAAYVKSVEGYNLPHIKQREEIIKQLKSGKTVSNWTIPAAKKEIARMKADIAKAKKLKKVSQYPAYLSVGIWFDSKPSKEQIDLMKARAAKFAEAKRSDGRFSWDKDFKLTITGFRLLSFETKKTSEDV
jgi:hypothetical protein